MRQYQVQVDPNRLLARGIAIQDVIRAVRESNEDTGGRTVEFAGHEYAIRGRGYVEQIEDLRRVALRGGAPCAAHKARRGAYGHSPGAAPPYRDAVKLGVAPLR